MSITPIRNSEDDGQAYIGGASIPQHPLLSYLQWRRLRRGEIRKFTYYSLLGPRHMADGYVELPHAASHVVRLEDCP